MTTVSAPTNQLCPGLHRIELGFVNAYLIEEDDQLTLIDAGFPIDAPLIAGAIEGLGHDVQKLTRIVLTHGHVDHYGAAVDLRNLTGAKILLSEIDAEQVSSGLAGHAPMQVQAGFEELVAAQLADPDFQRKTNGASTATPMPIEPFEVDGYLVAGEACEGLPDSDLIATPGHCAGQLSILVKRGGGWLFTGDAAVNFGGPPAIAPIAEDLELAAKSFEKLRAYDFEIAAFGHGEPLTSGASAAFRSA
jgi:glyoxylase-like metal-dependent hydrolase (beta-lactamase superfamily II)